MTIELYKKLLPYAEGNILWMSKLPEHLKVELWNVLHPNDKI